MFVEEILPEGTRCWKGYEKKGMKTMFGKRVPNCVKKESSDGMYYCRKSKKYKPIPDGYAVDDTGFLFKEDLDPKGPEVTISDYTTTHFFMCGSAIKTAEKHTDKPGMERLIRLQDMIYKLEKAVMDTGESTDEAKEFAYTLHGAIMSQAQEIGIEEEVADYQQSHLNSIIKGDPKPGFGRVDLEEDLKAWFGKGKKGGAGGGGWDRYNTKGERIGKCGDSKKGEGKPKCLSKSRAASLRAKGGKKAIAAAVRKKRREDPNKNRRGKAKNVSNTTRKK